jgi:hypothetical protein
MSHVSVEFITVPACGDPSGKSCALCDPVGDVARQAATSGVSMALNRPLPGEHLVFKHVAAKDAAKSGIAGRDPPVLLVNGKVALEGPAWTERDVRRVVAEAMK